MHPRIQELAEQARTSVPAGLDVAEWIAEYNRRFARLIIGECCDMFVELRTRPADLAVLDVKKHFGVEE